MKPGDMIEWTYNNDGATVLEEEMLWSSIEKRYVPINSNMVHVLVKIGKTTFSWMNAQGVFRARLKDTQACCTWKTTPRVVQHPSVWCTSAPRRACTWWAIQP